MSLQGLQPTIIAEEADVRNGSKADIGSQNASHHRTRCAAVIVQCSKAPIFIILEGSGRISSEESFDPQPSPQHHPPQDPA
jgi:hypothetical protein